MEWVQFVILIITLCSMFVWQKSDITQIRAEAAADRRDILQLVNANRQETSQMIRAIQEEIKDFHGRLCAIEERSRK